MSAAQAARETRPQTKKRRRSAAERAPEPKYTVSGAGRPLEPSVRRDLEERLGHDLGRVRLHTDRAADAVCDLLGADAVTVGTDVFFRTGAYQPGTTDGRRLIAHELLHTIERPNTPGTLAAGRDDGAVSLPHEPFERATEETAREVTDPAASPAGPYDAEEETVPETAAPGPGWLRYATVTADAMRAAPVDPARLPDRLAADVLRSLRGDPADFSGRVRMRLARLSPELLDSVLGKLRTRLSSSEYDRLLGLVDDAETLPYGLEPAGTPAEVPDAVESAVEAYQERVDKLEADRRSGKQKDADAAEEKKDAAERDGQRAGAASQAQQDAATEDQDLAQRTQQEDARAAEEQRDEAGQEKKDDQRASERRDADQKDAATAEKQKDDGDRTTEARKEQREREEADPEQASEPGSKKKEDQDKEQRQPDGAKKAQIDPKKADAPGEIRPEKVDERADERDSPLVRHGLDDKDEDEGEPREEEQPIGAEADADADIGQSEADTGKGGKIRGEAEIKPEDHLPDADLDISGVPTADQIKPGEPAPASVPSFPKPPPTKAEQKEARREDDADADEQEDDDSPESPAKAPGEEQGPVAGEAPKPEGGPAAEAGDRAERDLQPDKPTDQEVGPDPEQVDRPEREQRPEDHKDPEQQQDAGANGNVKAKATEKDKDAERDDSGDGTPEPDAKSADDEKQERKDADEHEEKRDAQGRPDGDAADSPTGVKPSGTDGESDAAADTATAKAAKPAGAHAEPADTPDRHPSPAAARVAEHTKPDREAAPPKSTVRKETGQGGEPAAPEGEVGGSQPAHAPSSAAGPGGVPPAGSASASPADEQDTEKPGKAKAESAGSAQPKKDASLEKDGGGCAPPAPPQEPEASKCSAGGGGGKKPDEKKKGKPKDVSNEDPKNALATVSKLPPDESQQALPQVNSAADNKVTKEHNRLRANPPRRERPSGAPRTQARVPASAPPAPKVTGKLERVGPEPEGKKQEAKGGNKAEGAKPAANVPVPHVPAGKDGKVDPSDVHDVKQAAANVPTTDPALENKTVGPAPKIRLEGKSDPRRTDKQVSKLKEKQGKFVDTGRADASKNLGEDKIFPNAPREQLSGKVPGGGARTAGGEKANVETKPGYGEVAQQERGPQIAAGAGQAQTRMGAEEKKQTQGAQQEKQKKQQEINSEVARNADQQTRERGNTADEARKQRTKWRDEQDTKIKDTDEKTKKEHTDHNKKIVKHRDDNDKKVGERKKTDDKDIDHKRTKAESDARKKKKEKEDNSGGLLGGIIHAVADFFKGLLKAITDIFDAARKAINGVIDQFKKWADGIIDAVRDFAVGLINALADVLIGLVDVLLAAFPALRDKFRNAIESLRDKAINAVNKLADGLKAAVNKLLDALGAALNALLTVLEAGLKAAIKIYQTLIVGALKFVQKAISLLGKFAALIAEIAPDPGGWVSKAGSAMKTGITQYLWGAIKTAVKAWFDEKVQSVLGLGKMIINILIKGCMSLKQIGKMAWDAVIAAIPMMIVTIVIEKLVSLIFPAGGAILTIVQTLMAAWGTVSRVLAAFGKLMDFLMAVRAGPAACLFAEFVAASVVAVLEFITNYLLQRLGRALKPVGARLKTLAQKIMKGLKKVGKGARKVAGKTINKAKAAARKATQAMRKPTHPGKPKGAHVPPRSKTTASHAPGGPKRPPRHPDDHDRPPSHTPNRKKEKQHEEADAKKTHDREKQNRDRDKYAGDRDKHTAEHPPKHPEERRPDERPPHERKHDEDTPKKKPKETEAPKRQKPKEPKSRAGRALNKVKNAAKGAVRKVRNGLKALGRKLRKSKLGQALKRVGKKVRDLFKRKRNNLRERLRRREEQRKRKREERKKKENSKDSKEARLQKIIARIRPQISGKLRHGGLQRPVLNALLAGLRIWHRLTSLSIEGTPPRAVQAVLNPSGVPERLSEAEKNKLLSILREETERAKRNPDVQEQAQQVSLRNREAEEIDPRHWQELSGKESQRQKQGRPELVTEVKTPEGVSSLAAAVGFSQRFSEVRSSGQRTRSRRIYIYGKTPFIAYAGSTGNDPYGEILPLTQDAHGKLSIPQGLRGTYPGIAGTVSTDLTRLNTLQAAGELKRGNFSAAQSIADPQALLNAAVPYHAEMARGAYAPGTVPGSFEAARAGEEARIEGRPKPPGSMTLEEMYRTMPYSQRGAPGASRQAEYEERKAVGALLPGQKKGFYPYGGRQRPQEFREDVIEHIVQMLILNQIITEAGAEEITYDELRSKFRELLRDPSWRRKIFGVD